MKFTQKHRKLFFLFELLFCFLIFLMVTVSVQPYWRYNKSYELSLCQTEYYNDNEYFDLRDQSGIISCSLVNPSLVKGNKIYIPIQEGTNAHRRASDSTPTPIPTKGKYELKSNKKEKFEQCQRFKQGPEADVLPTDKQMNLIVIVGFTLIVLVILIRIIGYISITYRLNIDPGRGGRKALAKFDFWTINLLLFTGNVTVIGLIPAIYFNYTKTCVEAKNPHYDGETNSTQKPVLFWVALVFTFCYNGLWYAAISSKLCCRCCSFPPLIYYSLNVVQWIFSCLILCCINYLGEGLRLSLTYIIWGLGYSIYTTLFLKEFPYKQSGAVQPSSETKGRAYIIEEKNSYYPKHAMANYNPYPLEGEYSHKITDIASHKNSPFSIDIPFSSNSLPLPQTDRYTLPNILSDGQASLSQSPSLVPHLIYQINPYSQDFTPIIIHNSPKLSHSNTIPLPSK